MIAAVKAVVVFKLMMLVLMVVAIVSARIVPEHAATVTFLMGVPVGSAALIGWLVWTRLI